MLHKTDILGDYILPALLVVCIVAVCIVVAIVCIKLLAVFFTGWGTLGSL